MEFLKELFLFMKIRKTFWLIPLIVVLVLLSAIAVISAIPSLAPFIYSLF